MKINHAPWDGGAITGIFRGTSLEQKTVKTLCGKRVPMSQANDSIEIIMDCPKCNAVALDRAAGLELIRQSITELKEGN